MKKLLFLIWINIFAIGFAQVKSPNEFIPTYGKQITLYHQVEDYFNHLLEQGRIMSDVQVEHVNLLDV